MKANYNLLATDFCEKYGIVNYKLSGSSLVYYTHDYEGTYKHTKNFRTNVSTSVKLKRRNTK